MKNKALQNQIFLAVGIVASIIVGVGEWMLHYVPGGPTGENSMLDLVPLERASTGHFLAVFAVPFYFAGYYALMRIFEKGSPLFSRALCAGGILSFSMGAIWIGSRYFAAEVFQRSAGTADHEFFLHSYEVHLNPVVWALRILILGVSVTYVACVLKNRIGMPKWLAVFNPITLLIFNFSLLFWAKPIGAHITPIAMNATHLIFFGIVFVYYRRYTKSVPAEIGSMS
ncbi:hypothetical protein OAF27_00495 [Verrucomicrobiales bacterium]|nr:hypothetical protein [Verrucomicrobiales bacterium]